LIKPPETLVSGGFVGVNYLGIWVSMVSGVQKVTPTATP